MLPRAFAASNHQATRFGLHDVMARSVACGLATRVDGLALRTCRLHKHVSSQLDELVNWSSSRREL